jgi:hypothetical protein
MYILIQVYGTAPVCPHNTSSCTSAAAYWSTFIILPLYVYSIYTAKPCDYLTPPLSVGVEKDPNTTSRFVEI